MQVSVCFVCLVVYQPMVNWFRILTVPFDDSPLVSGSNRICLKPHQPIPSRTSAAYSFFDCKSGCFPWQSDRRSLQSLGLDIS